LRKDYCETSLFHHGLVKLLVLDGLQKIGRDWSSFIYMAGFQSKTGLTPQPLREREESVEEPTIVELRKEARGKKKVKSQLNKPVKPLVIKEPPQPPQSSSKEKVKQKKDVQGSTGSEKASRVKTRGQLSKEKGKSVAVEESPISKASLSDLLEAIEFEQEEPVHLEPMHIDLTQSSPESTKKSKASKRLRFDEPSEEFMFKPRRPVTRKQIKEAEKVHKGEEAVKEKVHKAKKAVKSPRTEVIEVLTKTVEAVKHKDKNKKVIITQGGNVIAIKSQVKTAIKDQVGATKEEIVKAKNVIKERAVRYANYKRAVLKGSKNLVGQTDSVADVYTWTVPALKQAKLLRKMNLTLRAKNKALKKEISNLKMRLGQLAH
jgi:hypothetical protein